MIFDTDAILEKALEESDLKACAFRASKASIERLKKLCKKDGVKGYSVVLSLILKQFIEYIADGNEFEIRVHRPKDRIAASFSCSASVWEEFTNRVSDLNLDRVRVLEYLMNEYCSQRSGKNR